jgi:hypothetical protein
MIQPSFAGVIVWLAVMCAAVPLAKAEEPLTTPVAVVTSDEASLPDASTGSASRSKDLFPPPDVVQVSPAPDAPATRSPFSLTIRFKAHNGSAIDASSIRLTYLKAPPVDLTPRLKAYLSTTGIAVPAATFPVGKHAIRVTVADTDHRVREATIAFSVAAN